MDLAVLNRLTILFIQSYCGTQANLEVDFSKFYSEFERNLTKSPQDPNRKKTKKETSHEEIILWKRKMLKGKFYATHDFEKD